MMKCTTGHWVRVITALNLVLPFSAAFSAATPTGEAPRDGMMTSSSWSTGIKEAVGTSYEAYDSELKYSESSRTAPISRVWFAAARGILNEIYWPTLDTPQVKDNQILVTDGSSFLFEEGKDSKSETEWLKTGVPAFRITNRDPKGRFVIEKTLFTDPDRDSVIQRVKITRSQPGLKFYVLHKPAVENTPLGDSAYVRLGERTSMHAWQTKHAQAVVFSIPLKQITAGFAGSKSDGWQDLKADYKLDSSYASASHGNVVMTAWLDIPETAGTTTFEQVIAFGKSGDAAEKVALATLASSPDQMLHTYLSQWESYQGSVRNLGRAAGDDGKLFRASIAVLKVSEDKTYEGGFIASPSVPWGNHLKDHNGMPISERHHDNQTGGYHAVWPRDLYQMATSFMAVEDYSSAVASLNYLRRVQYRNSGQFWDYDFRRRSRDGSWGQSLWANGADRWTGLQMDETAMPLMLTYRLWKAGKISLADYWEMVRDGADFIADFGPWSAMERWEEAMGASPSNIAAMISALWTSADMAEAMGDQDRAKRYRSMGDSWSSKPNDNLESWLFTTTGGHGNGAYYERVDGASSFKQFWNPNDDTSFLVANGGGHRREKDVIDGGFLELVRYGVRGALDHPILESIPEYDSTIRFDLPGHGPGFMRYVGDRYNYSDLTGEQTDAMLWPLLTGERAHYELAAALEKGKSKQEAAQVVDPFIRTIESFATEHDFIPEQVWREGPGMGKSTGAATPLGWSHAEYLKLLRSRIDAAVFDHIPLVTVRRRTLEGLVDELGWDRASKVIQQK